MPVFKSLLGLGAMAVLCLAACQSGVAEKAPPSVVRVDAEHVRVASSDPLKVVPATLKESEVTLELPGRMTIPDRDVRIFAARVEGRLEQLNVSVGDTVKKGEVIGRIWSAALSTAVEEYRIADKEGDASLVRLSRQKLQTLGLMPEDIVQESSSVFPLRSPFSGVVLERKAVPGSAVQSGDALMTVGELSAHQFIGELPPEQGVKVRPGMLIRFDEMPDLTAKVETVSPVADPQTRLVKIRGHFTGDVPKLLPAETFLRAKIVLQKAPALRLPKKALVLSNAGEVVFVRDAADAKLFRRVAVRVESRDDGEISVTRDENLSDGTLVVADGGLLLNKILDEKTED